MVTAIRDSKGNARYHSPHPACGACATIKIERSGRKCRRGCLTTRFQKITVPYDQNPHFGRGTLVAILSSKFKVPDEHARALVTAFLKIYRNDFGEPPSKL